jgi:hypothetical protein
MGEYRVTLIAKKAEGSGVTAHRVVTFGTAAYQVKKPSGANAAPAGVVMGGEEDTFSADNTVDIAKGGVLEIEVGSGDVTGGKFVYLDSDGCVNDIPAAGAQAQNINAVGIAQATAEDGELVQVEWAPCLIHIPATG